MVELLSQTKKFRDVQGKQGWGRSACWEARKREVQVQRCEEGEKPLKIWMVGRRKKPGGGEQCEEEGKGGESGGGKKS